MYISTVESTTGLGLSPIIVGLSSFLPFQVCASQLCYTAYCHRIEVERTHAFEAQRHAYLQLRFPPRAQAQPFPFFSILELFDIRFVPEMVRLVFFSSTLLRSVYKYR